VLRSDRFNTGIMRPAFSSPVRTGQDHRGAQSVYPRPRIAVGHL